MEKLKVTEKHVIEKLYGALVLLPRWKRKLILWFWPEIREVADTLRKLYWDE